MSFAYGDVLTHVDFPELRVMILCGDSGAGKPSTGVVLVPVDHRPMGGLRVFLWGEAGLITAVYEASGDWRKIE